MPVLSIPRNFGNLTGFPAVLQSRAEIYGLFLPGDSAPDESDSDTSTSKCQNMFPKKETSLFHSKVNEPGELLNSIPR